MSSGAGPEIVVVDYGLGNLHSVRRALESLGARARLSSEPDVIVHAERVILPGVGAFGDGMKNLRERGLVEAVRQHAAAGKPLLGICLGMQLLFDGSSEFGSHEGLGILGGQVIPIPTDLGVKVPHVGWNRIDPAESGSWSGTLLADIEPGAWVYFVHSFAASPTLRPTVLARTNYGGHEVTAAAHDGRRVVGCQFHPELSGDVGLEILARFLSA